MAETSPISNLPPELLMEVLTRLSWRQQLGVRRVCSRWRAAVDVCLARRQELYISMEDQDIILNDEMLLSLLKSMPALRQLCIEPLDAHCVDRMDRLPVDRLCTSCPRLQVISLDCIIDEADLETLLRRLPNLRSLHLTDAADVEGDCLSLLPTGLQSLTLNNALNLNSAKFRHLTRCPQLRELDLSYTDVCSEDLAVAVAACPQLELLKVADCNKLTWSWLSELAHCPRLQELDIPGVSDTVPDLSGVLTACSRLERLNARGVYDPLPTFPNIKLPRLTHLDLSHTCTDDGTFRRLPDLLPGLRHLKIDYCDMLTDEGLASVLPRLTSLQVLEIKYGTRGYSEALISLIGLPLKALACKYSAKQAVSDVLRRCPSLAVLALTKVPFNSVRQIAADLVRHPLSANREVTLMLEDEKEEAVKIPASKLPRNVRVTYRRLGLWEELTGWKSV